MVYSQGKWTKHKVMTNSTKLGSVLPSTRKLSKRNFLLLLKRYRHVIVKPSNGSGGAGVIQVTSIGVNTFKVHCGKVQKKMGLTETYSFIHRKTTRKSKMLYIVQQKIPLATIKGKPFDVRVMVQRKKRSGWFVTGTMVKIAGSGYFITNLVGSKGKALPLPTAIRQSNIHNMSTGDIQRRIHQISLVAVRQLQKYYSIDTVGFDVGITPSGKVWIIEANFNPDKTYFLRLKDKSMYRRIMSFYNRR